MSRAVRGVVVALLVFALVSVGGLALIGGGRDNGNGNGNDAVSPAANGVEATEHTERAADMLIADVDGFVLSQHGTGPVSDELRAPGSEADQPLDPVRLEALREAGFLGGFVRTWTREEGDPGAALVSGVAYLFSQDAPDMGDVGEVPDGFELLEIADVPQAAALVGQIGEDSVYAQASFTAGQYMFEFSTLVADVGEASELIRQMVGEQHARAA